LASKRTKTIHRSSVTGRIVKASYAAAHPRETVTERVRVPALKKKNGK